MDSKLPFAIPNYIVNLKGVYVDFMYKDPLLTAWSDKRADLSQNSVVPWGKDVFRAKYIIDYQIVVLLTFTEPTESL